MNERELESKHIAELHSLASEAGIEGYRMLRREELIERLGTASEQLAPNGQSSSDSGDDGNRPRRRPRGKRGGEGRRGSSARSDEESSGGSRKSKSREQSKSDDDDASVQDGESGKSGEQESRSEQEHSLTGHFVPDARGGGLLSGEDGEAQLSAAQVKRCELRAGDLLVGIVKSGRKGRGNVVRVESVNARTPEPGRSPAFEELTAVTPTRRLELRIDEGDTLTRAADLLAPMAFGQRVLVRAQARSGRTGLLQGIARSITAGSPQPVVIALLVDEKPEDITGWKQVVGSSGEVYAAGADLHVDQQRELSEFALARAKRLAEDGTETVLIIDSLTRLAVAADDPAAVKQFFGAGRDLSESAAGSLTVIATALTDVEDAPSVLRAVETTENTSLELSAGLAAEGIVPALVAIRPSVAGEELIRDPGELSAARRLRAELRLMPAEQAARTLAERIGKHSTNAELLSAVD